MLANLSLKGRLWLLGITAALGMGILAMSSIMFTASSKGIFVSFVDQRIARRGILQALKKSNNCFNQTIVFDAPVAG